MKKYNFIFSLLCFSLIAADYPSTDELWKSFTGTSGSRVHVNRVFIRPDAPLLKEKKLQWKNANILKSNARYKARRVLRNDTLNRIFSNFVPGEKAFMVVEKYDLYHECTYTAYVFTRKNMFFYEINENPEKGVLAVKYPLDPVEVDRFVELSEKIKHSHGSCDMTDSRDYPTFISVKRPDGEWETAICSATNYTWNNPNDKQIEYFKSVSEFMTIISEMMFIRNSRQVPPIVIKKK